MRSARASRRGLRARRRHGAVPLALLGMPAALTLLVLPLSAAMAGKSWQRLCAGGQVHWILLPDPGRGDGPAEDRPAEDGAHGVCAHAMCPRARGLNGRIRLPG